MEKTSARICRKDNPIVDDIVRTGATLRACAQRLYEGFPLKVIKTGSLRQELPQQSHAPVL